MKPLFSLALLALPAFAAFPNGYSYCKIVTTQHAMVSGSSDLTNYPLTVILSDTDLRTTVNGGLVNNSSGYDIGFYPNCSGTGAAFKWELESYSPATGAIVAHVLRTTLSHTADDTIGMVYGGAFTSFQSTAPTVWDSNFKSVWHLQNGSGLAGADSTSNGYNLTNNGATATTGEVDGGASFVRTSSQYMTSAGAPVTAYPLTISAWVKMANAIGTGEDRIIVSIAKTSGLEEWWFGYLEDQGTKCLRTVSQSVGGAYETRYAVTPDTNWHHVVAVLANSASNLIYYDGAAVATASAGTAKSPSGLTDVYIGGLLYNTSNFYGGQNGVVDEVRISNTVRSADWILTEYRNQSAPGTYLSAGPRIAAAGTRVQHTVRNGE